MNGSFSVNLMPSAKQVERENPAPSSALLQVGGLTTLSTSDYPGMLAAVVFCQGCPWRCGYCQNPHLLARRSAQPLSWRELRDFFHRRRGLLDAVVFSGGEPTLQKGLLAAVKEVREMGFKAGLHTGGAYPDRLAQLLPYLDWVGMDVKTRFAKYDQVTLAPDSGVKAKKSVQLLLESGVDHEFRTTLHPLLISRQQLDLLARDLVQLGVEHYVLQKFRRHGCINPEFVNAAEQAMPDDLHESVGAQFSHFTVR